MLNYSNNLTLNISLKQDSGMFKEHIQIESKHISHFSHST